MRPTTTCKNTRTVLIKAIKEHIKATALTQKSVAQITGLTQQRVSRLLQDEGVSLDTLINVASLLGLEISILINETS